MAKAKKKTTVTLVCVATGEEKEFLPERAKEILGYKKQGGYRLKEEDGANTSLRAAKQQAEPKSDNDCGCP